MTWVLVALLALLAFAVMAFLLKAPRPGWAAIGSALLLGAAGYAAQSRPDLPGSPLAAREATAGNPGAVTARQSLSAGAPAANKWLVIADAMARNGQYAAAAEVLRGAVAANPKDGDAWLAMANALVSHAEGRLSPAALLAFRRAEAASPGSPGPPFFLGLALAQAGRFPEARAQWAELLARSPAEAPWRADLAARLQQLDQLIAEQAGAGASR
jgi:cytochrome c-type biogenesis protein CcmH